MFVLEIKISWHIATNLISVLGQTIGNESKEIKNEIEDDSRQDHTIFYIKIQYNMKPYDLEQ